MITDVTLQFVQSNCPQAEDDHYDVVGHPDLRVQVLGRGKFGVSEFTPQRTIIYHPVSSNLRRAKEQCVKIANSRKGLAFPGVSYFRLRYSFFFI